MDGIIAEMGRNVLMSKLSDHQPQNQQQAPASNSMEMLAMMQMYGGRGGGRGGYGQYGGYTSPPERAGTTATPTTEVGVVRELQYCIRVRYTWAARPSALRVRGRAAPMPSGLRSRSADTARMQRGQGLVVQTPK